MFGLQGAFPMAPTWLQWALAAVIAALAAVGMAVRRRAMWILLMPLIYAVAAWGLVVGSSRFGSLGQFASLDSRYSADLIAPVVLAFVLLATSTRQERGQGGAWTVALPATLVRWLRIAAVAATLCIVMSSLVTWSAQMDGLGPNSPRSWTDRLLASAREAGDVVVFDSNAPDNVVYPAFLPDDARVSRMLAPLGLPLRFDVPTEAIFRVADNGAIVPGRVVAQSRTLPGPDIGCGYLLVPGAPAREVPVSKQMYNWNWGMEIGFLAQGPGTVRVGTDLTSQDVPVDQGLGTRQSVIVSSISSVWLAVTDGPGPVCVDYVSFGPVDPA